MAESTKSEKEYDVREIYRLFETKSITGTKNISVTVYTSADAVNALLKSRVRENRKHGCASSEGWHIQQE